MKSIQQLDIILASTATWRSQILNQLGIPHRQIPPEFDEPDFQDGSIQDFVEILAYEKARSLAEENPDSWIIASDQMAIFENQVLGKPGNKENALKQLKLLSGKTHELYCSLVLVRGEEVKCGTLISRLTMRELSEKELQYYIEKDRPEQCAGSYKIESLGATLFSSVETPDYNAIIGLPGILLIDFFREMGISNLLD